MVRIRPDAAYFRSRRDQVLLAAKEPLAGAIGRAISATGHAVEALSSRRTSLVIAPHPDDETLGCGATILRKADLETRVEILVMTDGALWPPGRPREENIATRAIELARVGELMGLAPGAVRQERFPDGGLKHAENDMVDVIRDALREINPEEILVTSPFDPHGDHAAVGRAALTASAGLGVAVRAYPIWQWTRPNSWIRMVRASRKIERVSTAGYLDRKRQLIAAYGSQLAPTGDRRSGAGLDEAFIANFLGSSEMFFVLRSP